MRSAPADPSPDSAPTTSVGSRWPGTRYPVQPDISCLALLDVADGQHDQADYDVTAKEPSASMMRCERLAALYRPRAVADDAIASRLIAEYQPRILVLNAGATPHPATIQDQTWDTFSENGNVNVRHVFEFAREALLVPSAQCSRASRSPTR